MVKIDLFCTGAYTEIGGLSGFLERTLAFDRGEVANSRRFPAVDKNGPKIGVPAPVARHMGATGRTLEQKMTNILSNYGTDADLVVPADDADCRWCPDHTAWPAWQALLQQSVDGALRRHVPVITLLASPEVEAWFIADWTQGFLSLDTVRAGDIHAAPR